MGVNTSRWSHLMAMQLVRCLLVTQLRYADKRIVKIIKVYIETSNLQP